MALNPFTSKIIADTGISMGDEGKGRLIPEVIAELKELTGKESPVAIVLKVNGGANSGHTVDGLKLNLIPGGVTQRSVPYMAIGAGVVADPLKFRWENNYIEKNGYEIRNRLLIDERCMLSDFSHRILDLAWEFYRSEILGEEKRGSTARGISPCFSEETSQWQMHYLEFKRSKELFVDRFQKRLSRAELIVQHVCQVSEKAWDDFFDFLTTAEKRANSICLESGHLPEEEFDFTRFKGSEPFKFNQEEITETYWKAGQELIENITDVREKILSTLSDGDYVIGEFGQSFWLDKRFGFTPNLTASHTYVPEFFNSACIPFQAIHNIGVCKGYDTKVGTHVFITQFDDEHPLAKKLKKLEFGVSTGRQRMVGWFDAVEKGDALRYGGFQDLCLNKIDALSYSGEWQGGELLICTSYTAPDGRVFKHVPRDTELHKTLKPNYIQLPGWSEDISGVRKFEDLPENAKVYVATMMKCTLDVAYEGVEKPDVMANLRYVGVGPEPEQIIKDIPEISELIQLAR